MLPDDENSNKCYDAFLSEYSKLHNLSFPIKTRSVNKSHKPRIPWMAMALLVFVTKTIPTNFLSILVVSTLNFLTNYIKEI